MEPNRLHIVDATMFWSPTGGGVRRYLLTKHDWFGRAPGFRHSLAVPFAPCAAGNGCGDGGATGAPPGSADLPSWPLPGGAGYRLPLSRGAIGRAIASLAPDVVEAGDPYRVAWGALDAARAGGAAAVAFVHSDLEAMARLVAGRAGAALARRYAARLYRRFDLVLVPGAALRQTVAAWGVDGAVVQPLGVDVATFSPARRSTAWRRRLGLDDDARVLVYAGRFAPEKNLPQLADAVARLGPPYVLVAIGAGPSPPAGPGVRVAPYLADPAALAEALASADAFVHAGDQETFGLSALEAMAAGTPAVVRAAGGLAELVPPGADPARAGGIAVERGSGAAFAAAIEALFAADRAAVRAAARRRAEASSWDRVLPGLAAHYRRLRGAAGDATADDPAVPPRRAAPLPVR